MFRLFYFFLLTLIATPLLSSNYNGEIYSFKQPDGSTVDVKLFGSEFYIRAEGLNGYTVVREDKSGWIYYAELSPKGDELIPTQIKYTINRTNINTKDLNLNLPKHLDIKPEYVRERMNKNAKALFGLPTVEAVQKSYTTHQRSGEVLQGNVKGLCIVIDFSDEVSTLDLSEYEDLCNSLHYTKFGNNGSLRQYYADISGGLLDYENVVFGIFRAPKTFKEYDAMPYATGAQEILGLALNWIKDQGFDFSTLSVNPDNTIQAINMMYMGDPPKWAQGMWFHQGYYGGFSANGVRSGRYNTSPAKAPLTIATVVHENGHMICKWPDTYKYNSDTGPDGIGTFDVMCATGPNTNPPLPNPYFMNRIGWGKDINMTGENTTIRDTSNSYTSYSYRNPNNSAEYYMFQSRLKTGRSVSIPDEGLIVWHINENGDNQTVNHMVYVVHQNNNISNHAEALFRKGRLPEYNDSSVPSSNWYDKSESGLRLWNFSAAGEIMTYNIGQGPSLGITYVRHAKTNGDTTIHGGDQFDIVVKINNFDSIASTSAQVSCTPFGENKDFIEVTNPIITPGEIAGSESKEVVFTVEANSLLSDLEKMNFKFEVEENNRTDFSTTTILTGPVVVMDTLVVNECGFNFMDPGGFDDYSDSTDIIQTFVPTEPGHKIHVEWIDFSVEPSTGCQNDVLRVYNGMDIHAPLVNKLCGAALPENILADNPDGALTFRFLSSVAKTFPGWLARVTCVPVSAVRKNNPINVLVYPNPTSGIVNISLGQPGDYRINITDTWGRSIKNISLHHQQFAQIDMTQMSSGIYFAVIQKDRNTITKKFIVK